MNRHSIYYSSDAYTWMHTDNKQSSFKNNIISESLNYLPSGPLEVALVNLTITLKEKIQKGSESEALQLGVRSTLQKDISIRGSGYDNIIYTFTILPSSKRTINYEIPTTQHVYLQTTRANLEKAAFQIINLKDNKLCSEIDYSPKATFIEVAVQPHTMTSNAMILSSNDASCIRNCANKNMNFTTYLPEQLAYQGQTWAVVCKGLQTTGKFWNVQDDTFTVKYIKEKEEEEKEEEELFPAKKLKKNRISIIDEQVVSYIGLQRQIDGQSTSLHGRSKSIPAGEYDNIEKLVETLNNCLHPLIGIVSELVKIEFKPTTDGKMLLELGFVLDDYSSTSEVILTIPSELSRILGYSNFKEQKEFQFEINNTTVTFQSGHTYQNYELTAVAAATVEEQMDTDTAVDTSSSSRSFEETTIILEQGYYRTRLEVVNWLNNELKAHEIETVSFDITKGQVTGKLSAATKIRITQPQRNTSTSNKERLILSPKLAKMLGFTNDIRQQYSVDLDAFNSNQVSQHGEDLNVGLPSNLLVNMDVVETRVVGDKHLPVIQAIHIGHQGGEDQPAICHFVFRENNHVLLDTKLFSKVKITITDINGVPVKAEQDYPTIIHLSFVKYG